MLNGPYFIAYWGKFDKISSVQYVAAEQNISITTGGDTMKFSMDIDGPQKLFLDHFGAPLDAFSFVHTIQMITDD